METKHRARRLWKHTWIIVEALWLTIPSAHAMVDPPTGRYHLKGILFFDESHLSLVVNPASRSAYKVRLTNWDMVADQQKGSHKPFMKWVEADLSLTLKVRPGLGEGRLVGYKVQDDPKPQAYDSRLRPIPASP